MAWNPSLYELTVTPLANAVLYATTQRSAREFTGGGVAACFSEVRRVWGCRGSETPQHIVSRVIYRWLVCTYVSVCLWYM